MLREGRDIFVVSNSQDSVEDIGFHFIDNAFPLRQVAKARKEMTLSEKVLERYVGEYQLPDINTTFTVARKGQRLFLQQPGEAKVGLFAEGETEFFLKATWTNLE